MGSITRRQLSLLASILAALFLTHQIIASLSALPHTIEPEVYLRRCVIFLSGFFFVIAGAWAGFRFLGGLLFALFASVMVFFVGTISDSSFAVWLVVQYGLLCFLLFRIDEYFQNQTAGLLVDREKYQSEKNDLELSYRQKGEGISIFFEKYSNYYNLRKLAEELATTLSVSELAQTVVARAADFIPAGGQALVTFSDPDGIKMTVMASHPAPQDGRLESPEGDLFDRWAVRNRKRLIVSDTQQDFRFDPAQTAAIPGLRSLIIAPLLHERKVLGTLRMNSSKESTFSNDELRILDAISTLASSAFSSALLFAQTEELAIRDSLTGLYVRRYFFERLKHEHRRAMMSNRPLSLLLCDLDRFKDCNDRFGHGAGDLMLCAFAEILRGHGENSLAARYGGEEFVLLLPELAKPAAARLAESIRMTLESQPFIIRRVSIPMTVSIGVAGIPDDTLDAETLVQKCDEALYRAKRSGRNRVCLSGG